MNNQYNGQQQYPNNGQQQQNNDDNRGSLWRNDKKVQGDNKPDFTGKCEVGGMQYRMSMWLASQESLQENDRRPVMKINFRTEAEFQEMLQRQHEHGHGQAQNVLNQPQQQYSEAGYMQSPQQQQQYQHPAPQQYQQPPQQPQYQPQQPNAYAEASGGTVGAGGQPAPPQQQQPARVDDWDDDIPF